MQKATPSLYRMRFALWQTQSNVVGAQRNPSPNIRKGRKNIPLEIILFVSCPFNAGSMLTICRLTSLLDFTQYPTTRLIPSSTTDGIPLLNDAERLTIYNIGDYLIKYLKMLSLCESLCRYHLNGNQNTPLVSISMYTHWVVEPIADFR